MQLLLSISLSMLLFQVAGAKLPELTSRVSCGGCGGVNADVGFRTNVTQDAGGKWEFRNSIRNNGNSPAKIFIILPKPECLQMARDREAKDIDLECGIPLDLKASESMTLQFAIRPPDSKPVESFGMLWILNQSGQKVASGRITIYWSTR